MPLEKKHKIIIGSFSSVIILVLIANSILLYVLFAKVNYNVQVIDSKITELQTDTQSKFNELTENLIQTQQSLGETITTLDVKLNQLKASASSDFSGIIEQSIKSVVTVKTNVAQGTGFLISPEGYVVTNAHVLSGGKTVYIITSEQETKYAEFVGYDGTLDVALLKIEGESNYLELANSNEIQVGQKVIAIGNPLGLQFSVSEGIISAVHRTGPNEIDSYLQTDAALNPGNSGGPLINTEGKVVGINNFKVSDGENLGFALESNILRETINNIAVESLGTNLI